MDEIEELKLTSPIRMSEVHVENQLGLLREDLVRDTRESIQVALGTKPGKRTGEFITGLTLASIYADDKSKWGLTFDCEDDLPFFGFAIDPEDRKVGLERTETSSGTDPSLASFSRRRSSRSSPLFATFIC